MAAALCPLDQELSSAAEPDKPSRKARRQLQSRTARALALELIQQDMGSDRIASEIGRDAEGRPIFPDGMVGSLSHTGNFAAAAVARQEAWRSIGIDIEPAKALPGKTASVLLSANEAQHIAALSNPNDDLDRLIFCAKECVHKAIEPLTGVRLGFLDVEVSLFPEDNRFQVSSRTRRAEDAFTDYSFVGGYQRIEGHLLAILALRQAT